MARNRDPLEDQKSRIDGTFSAPKPPTFGILTQTLVRSPVIRYIIPARIRHQKYNDVLFIYSNHIEIKEIVTQDYLPDLSIELRDIAVKSDFDSPIRAARIFGSPRKITPSVQEPTGIDAIIKNEESSPGDDTDQYHVGTPPQILVLSLQSKKLVFLFAFHDSSEAVHFLSSERLLPSHAVHNEQLGEHLAVDPKSRAMAVAAWEGSLVVYSLKSMDQLKDELESGGQLLGDRFMPIRSERHLQVEGTILKMEFLHPQENDDDHVILLLVVSRDRKTALLWYDWDSSKSDLPNPHVTPVHHRISPAEQIPLLLIPLTMSAAFMLICETQIAIYKGILTRSTAVRIDQLEHMEAPEEPGSSKRLPLWTQWARPMRGKEYRLSNQDGVYLCREDGVVRYLRIDDKLGHKIDSSHRAGMLKVNIDTAFASIDLGVHHTDLLAAGGDLCNGGLWIFPPRKDPSQKVMIPNWTPMIDYTTAPVSHSIQTTLGLPARTDPSPIDHSRIFACTGKGARHGAITEMRYGIEAVKIGPTMEVGDINEGGILQIWALNDPTNGGTYLIVAHPTVTSLLFIASDGTELVQVEESFGLDYDTRTIAADITAEGFLIQVTEKSIIAASPNAHAPRFESRCDDERIVAASIKKIQSNESTVLTAVRDDQGCRLHLGYFTPDNTRTVFKQLGDSVLLPSEPSCISIQWIWGQLFAFVATTVGSIQVFRAALGSTFSPVHEYSFEGHFAVCESIAMITLRTDSAHLLEHALVCGLRNGAVQILCLRHLGPSDNDLLSLCETIDVGSTSVSVATDKMRVNRAIVVCEHQIYTLEYPSKSSRKAPATLNKVHFTGHDLPNFQQGTMTSFTQTDPVTTEGFMEGAIYFLTANQLHMACLKQEPYLVPRQLPIDGSPTRILYSSFLQNLIALYIRISITQPRQTNGHHVRAAQRALRPVISFLDPNSDPVEHDPDGIDTRGVRPLGECNPGEKVLGMMEWFPLEEDDKTYPLLILNTLVKQSGQAASGRLLLFAIRRGVDGEIALDYKNACLEFDFPVYAVASYGRSSLIYCCGKDLVLHKLVMNGSKRWNRPVRYAMGSPVAHITVHADEVYVTTTKDSLNIFKIEDENIIYQFTDQVARNGLHHLVLPDHSLTLVSGMGCEVVGLWKPPRPRIDNSMCTVFQAVLPGSITRFRRITRARWYRESSMASKSKISDMTPSFLKSSLIMANSHKNYLNEGYPNGKADAIIGSSADGTLYQLDILNESSWRLLRYIQNMATQDPIVCPFPNLFQNPDVEPSTSIKRHMQVNGDILHRLLDRGGEILLEDILDRGVESQSQDMMDLDTTDEDDEERRAGSQHASPRRERFEELVAEVADLDDGEGDVAAVVQWIRFKLLKAL